VVVRKQRFAPDSAGGGYSAPPDPLARIQRLTSKEKEGSGRKGGKEGKESGKGRGSGWEGSAQPGLPTCSLVIATPLMQQHQA